MIDTTKAAFEIPKMYYASIEMNQIHQNADLECNCKYAFIPCMKDKRGINPYIVHRLSQDNWNIGKSK